MVRSLGISLDPEGEVPLYRQIALAIAGRIRAGVLPPGFRLPPTRRLAEQLATHRNTVVRAFEELSADGWITSSVGRGSFVADRSAWLSPPASTDVTPTAGLPELPWSLLLSRAAESEPLARLERLTRSGGQGDTINLTRMQPSDELLPDAALRRCMDHVFRTLGPEALGYAPRQGLPRLRRLISEDLARAGVPADPEDILVTTGSQQAIDLIARALVNPGDTFLTEARTYSGALHVFAAAGARVVGVPGDDDGPDLAALDALARPRPKGLYAMPNGRNPTGTTMSLARREALVAWSRRAGVPLVEDDYGADLALDDAPTPPALRALDPNVFYVGTFSKKLIPALRVGFVVCPPSLTATLVSLKHAMDLGTSALLQHALAEFLDRGYLRGHLRAIIPAYRERRDALEAALAEHLPRGLTWNQPRRGLVLWLPLPVGLDPEEVFEEARRFGVMVSPSTLYATAAPAQPGLRLSFCSEPPDRLAEGARRLGRALALVMSRRRDAQGRAPHPATLDMV